MSKYEFMCHVNGKVYIDNLIEKYKSGTPMFDIERSTTRDTLSDIPRTAWNDVFQELGIQLRGLKDATSSEHCRSKYRQTCSDKYGDGIINVSQVQSIKDKKAETFMEHYGVDNIWKSPDFYVWLNDFMLKKYGYKRITGWIGKTQEERDEINRKRFETKTVNGYYDSMLEERVQRILVENNIKHKRCFWLYHHPYDFIIGDHINLLLEVNGDYWHANPKFYKASDIMREGVTAQDIWNRDKKFRDCLNGSKFKVIYLWEYDMK